MGGSSKPSLSPTQKKIEEQQSELNALALERIKREEAETTADESERQRLLSAGRFGRTSLLTGGFLGPGSTSRISRAETRAGEQQKTIADAASNIKKTGFAAKTAAAALAKKNKQISSQQLTNSFFNDFLFNKDP